MIYIIVSFPFRETITMPTAMLRYRSYGAVFQCVRHQHGGSPSLGPGPLKELSIMVLQIFNTWCMLRMWEIYPTISWWSLFQCVKLCRAAFNGGAIAMQPFSCKCNIQCTMRNAYVQCVKYNVSNMCRSPHVELDLWRTWFGLAAVSGENVQ